MKLKNKLLTLSLNAFFSGSLMASTFDKEKQALKEFDIEIQKLTQPDRDALKKASRMEPELERRLMEFNERLKQIDHKDRTSRKFLAAKYRSDLQKAISLSKWDEKSYYFKIQQAINRLEKKTSKRFKLNRRDFGTFYLSEFLPFDKTPEEALPDLIENLSFPFTSKLEDKTGGGHVIVNKEQGTSMIYAISGFIDGHTNTGTLIHRLTVPAGYRQAQVTVEIPGIEYNGSAFAGLGYGSSSARTIARVYLDDRVVCQQSKTHFSIQAPIVGFTEPEGVDELLMQCRFNLNSYSRKMEIHYIGETSALGAGLAGADSSLYVRPNNTEVSFSQN